MQLLNAPQPGQLPLKLKFQSKACGLLPNGSPALLEVRQTCGDDGTGQICPKAIVDVRSGKWGGGDD